MNQSYRWLSWTCRTYSPGNHGRGTTPNRPCRPRQKALLHNLSIAYFILKYEIHVFCSKSCKRTSKAVGHIQNFLMPWAQQNANNSLLAANFTNPTKKQECIAYNETSSHKILVICSFLTYDSVDHSIDVCEWMEMCMFNTHHPHSSMHLYNYPVSKNI